MIEWAKYQRKAALESEVRAWFDRYPNANIGIVTGRVSGIVVLDIDSREGMEYAKAHALPATPVSNTGRGWHYIFEHPGREARNFVRRLPGMDLRGDGGYIVAPPSMHPSGRTYEWSIEPWSIKPAPPPGWITDALTGPSESGPETPDWFDDAWRGVKEGQRNEAAAKLAGHYLRLGMGERETLRILSGWNRGNQPPLTDRELSGVVRSIAKREREGGGRNFEIERVQKVQSDRPIYLLRVFGCDVEVAGPDLASFSRFSQSVLQAADRMPTMRNPGKNWPLYINEVLATRLELLDTPEEASESEIIWGRALRYLSARASDEESSLADGRGVYSNETLVYFSGTALKSHLDSVGVAVRATQLWNLVRTHGGQPTIKHVRDTEGNRRTVRCWTLAKTTVFPVSFPEGDQEIL